MRSIRIWFMAVIFTVWAGYQNAVLAACVAGDAVSPGVVADLDVQPLAGKLFKIRFSAPEDASGLTYRLWVLAPADQPWSAAVQLPVSANLEGYGRIQTAIVEVPTVSASYAFYLQPIDDCGNGGSLSNVSQIDGSTLPSDSFSLENLSIDPVGNVSGTLYLVTDKNISGLMIYAAYYGRGVDMPVVGSKANTGGATATFFLPAIAASGTVPKVHAFHNGGGFSFDSVNVSTQSNALSGLVYGNLDAIHYQGNFDGTKRQLLDTLSAKGQKLALISAVTMPTREDHNTKTGKIALCDLKFRLDSGQTKLFVFADGIFDQFGVRMSPPQPLELILSR